MEDHFEELRALTDGEELTREYSSRMHRDGTRSKSRKKERMHSIVAPLHEEMGGPSEPTPRDEPLPEAQQDLFEVKMRQYLSSAMTAMLSEVKKDRETERKEWQTSLRAMNLTQINLAREMRDGLTQLEARFEELEATREKA
ncbi:hypothetical protein O6H91_22G007500 [Diphasiastrum complanatum]|uniref:Uncharacterized protein n=1 Tax=Diphasiastrum complanatum TaxID=34168 RepID=A0ACC2ACJ0_DIPCM|nr:hypothetical protein O6H91_22G007500 [Diphasiastrum complanatum]